MSHVGPIDASQEHPGPQWFPNRSLGPMGLLVSPGDPKGTLVGPQRLLMGPNWSVEIPSVL